MKKIISLLLVSISLIGQTTKRSPETRKGFANVFYDPRYTLFDLFSDEPIFPSANGKYEIIISSNENKSPQKFIGTGQDLVGLTMYKFKNLETHRKWANGEKPTNSSQDNVTNHVTSQAVLTQDPEQSLNPNKEKIAEENLARPIRASVASGDFSYFEGLIGDYKKGEINLSNPQSKDKNGNFLWGDITEENKDGFGIVYNPGKSLRIGEFKDFALYGSGMSLEISGRLSIGIYKANEITGLGFMGYLKDSTAFLDYAKQILALKTKELLVEENFQSMYMGTFIRNEKNEYVFDGKFVRNRFKEKSNLVDKRTIMISRQVNGKHTGMVKLILESPGGGSTMDGVMVYKGEVDAANLPKGRGFQYSIYPEKFVRLSGEFNGLFEVYGNREHSNGIKHEGLFKDDNLIGEGRMKMEGRIIKGTFKDYLPHGKARIEYTNGDFFEGNYVDGSAIGQGVFYTASTQEKLSGNFNEGKAHGKMKLIKGNKTTLVTYEYGERK